MLLRSLPVASSAPLALVVRAFVVLVSLSNVGCSLGGGPLDDFADPLRYEAATVNSTGSGLVEARAPSGAPGSSHLEDKWGPGELAALLTGTVSFKNRNLAFNIPTASWYVRNPHRKGVAILGGAVAYDMVSTQWSGGQPVGRRLTSHGFLGLAGHTDERRWDGSGYQKSHWFFPFYRYHNRNGERVVYPFFFFPVRLSRDPSPPALDIAPWEASTDSGFDPSPYDSSPTRHASRVGLRDPLDEVPPDPIDRGSDSTGSGGWHAQGGERSYQVVRGDTLYSIARREYGNAGAWRKIYDANRSAIADPHRIPVGLTLVLP